MLLPSLSVSYRSTEYSTSSTWARRPRNPKVQPLLELRHVSLYQLLTAVNVLNRQHSPIAFPALAAGAAFLLLTFAATAQSGYRATRPWADWAPSLDGGRIDLHWIAPESMHGFASILEAMAEVRIEIENIESESSANSEDLVLLGGSVLGNIQPDVQADFEHASLVLVVFNAEQRAAAEILVRGLDETAVEYIQRGVGGIDPNTNPVELAGVRAFIGENRRAIIIEHIGSEPLGQLALPPLETMQPGRRSLFENACSLLIRAIRWTANREPQSVIVSVAPDIPEGPEAIDTPPNIPVEFVRRLENMMQNPIVLPIRIALDQPAPRNFDLEARARFPGQDIELTYPVPEGIRRGQTAIETSVPIGRGASWLDIRLLDGNDVVDWHTVAIPYQGWPSMAPVHVSRMFARPNDSITVSTYIEKSIHAPRPVTVYCEAVDTSGRVVSMASRRVGEEGGAVSVPLILVGARSPMLTLNIYAIDNEPPSPFPLRMRMDADFQQRYVYMVDPYPEDFVVASRGLPSLESIMVDKLENRLRAGFNALAYPANYPANGPAVAEAGLWALPMMDAASLVDTRDSPIQPLESISTSLPRVTTDALAKDSLWRQRYNSALPERYRTHNALNATWGTRLPTWPDTAQWPHPSEWPKAAQLDFARFLVADIRNATPNAAFAPGRYAWTTEPTTDPLAYALRNTAVTQNSLWPYIENAEDRTRAVWAAIANGSDGVVHTNQLANDLSSLPQNRREADRMESEVHRLREATELVFPVIDSMQPKLDDIAIVFQEDSGLLHAFEAGTTRHRSAFDAAMNVLVQNHIQPRTARSIEKAVSMVSPNGVILLPAIEFLNQGDIDRLETFCKNGGTAIADSVPGGYDIDGLPVSRAAAARFFGANAELPGTSKSTAAPSPASLVPATSNNWTLMRNGDGGSLLLDMPFDEIADSSELQQQLYDALAKYGVTPANEPHESIALRRTFGRGPLEAHVAITQADARRDTTFRVRVPDGKHLYLPLEGEAYSPGRSVRIKAAQDSGALWTTLPYEVTRLVVTHPEELSLGSRLSVSIEVKTRGALAGDHPVRVWLIPRNDLDRVLYSRSAVLKNGKGAIALQLAHNETPGLYRVRTRDLLTGVETHTEVHVGALP